ncbi:hypothetical protein ALC53_11768 [Atta colombica]|uniref:Uncharacterized protein n=1 Tax=Atta colombica TaxID=520822 RepID=A0A195B0D5_9HYME|nr:hypothetical protein ALC53_11768 [Atta colombica]
MGTNRVRFHFIFSFELAAHSWQRVTNGEEAPNTRSCRRNGPYETRRCSLERVLRRQKGGARHKAVDHGGNATHGLFAFLSVDIAQLKSTSVITHLKILLPSFKRPMGPSTDSMCFRRPDRTETPTEGLPFLFVVSVVSLKGHKGSSRLLKENVTRSKLNEELCRRNRVLAIRQTKGRPNSP